jgi:uncharacterized lipoprotein YddW (UPF0748 family)
VSKLYDVVATTGKYQKDGQTKYLNKTVGSIIETKHGKRLKLAAWFNPAGCEKDEDGAVWLALFPPKDKQQNRQPEDTGFKDDDLTF